MPSGYISSDQITGQYLDANDRSAVVLIHGWTAQALQNPPVFQDSFGGGDWPQLVSALQARLNGTGTRLLLFHWEDDASTGPISFDPLNSLFGRADFNAAFDAASNGFLNGDRLSAQLNQAAPDLRRVTFIAHSAGAWVAYRALDKLLKTNPYVVVNMVLLDPFIPGVDPTLGTSLTTATMGSLANHTLEDRIYRLENYFSIDVTDSVLVDGDGSNATSQVFPWRSGDINGTQIGQQINQRVDYFNGSSFEYGGHDGPKLFFADTVIATTQGATVPSGLVFAPWDFTTVGFYRGLVNESFLLPSITTQPQAPATPVALGSTVTLSVSANRTDSFQWFKDGQPYPLTSPETSSTLTLSAVGASDAGAYVVRAKNSSGLTFSEKAVLQVASIQVAGIVPSGGSTQGGTLVTITGTGFEAGAIVRIGGVQATSVVVVSATTITAVTGAHTAGAVDVFVANLDTQSDTLSGGFTYIVITPGTGSLTVNLFPAGAVSAGAQWSVDGGSYHNDGESVTSLTSGTHTISFKTIPGYTAPADQTVTINANAQTTINATYTVSAGGSFSQQGPKLVGTGAVGNASQGYSVSLSADGNTAIIGGNGDNGGSGAAWVWTRSGGVWTQQGPKLVGSGAVVNPLQPPFGQMLGQQGSSVSISADGNTAIVGGPYDDGHAWQSGDQSGTRYAGATWVWTRSGGVWTQQGPKLVGSGAVDAGAAQGFSVSLSADGNTAIVGGARDNGGAYGSVGAAWVWTRSGGVWTQQGPKLVGAGAVGWNGGLAGQGSSVSLSADGNTAIVGGQYDNQVGLGGAAIGAAWVWTRSGGVWTQQGTKLVGSGVDTSWGARQGGSVFLSADGNTAIVGGTGGPSGLGAAWVWTRSAAVWTQQGPKLVGSAFGQGSSVSLSADDNTAIVGAPAAGNSNPGAALVWTRSGSVWTLQGNNLVGWGYVGNSQQGYSVSLSADGNTAILGGPADNSGAGAAWVFATSAPAILPAITTQPANQAVTAGANATFTVAASGTPMPTLQWQVSADGGSTFTDLSDATPYSGVTTATLTITAAPSSLNSARYRAVATNSAGSATSTAATLTVSPAPTPTISVTPAALTFSAVAGGGGPLGQSINVSNSGGGTLNWLAAVTSGAFISLVGTTSGANSGSFQVFADVGALSAGIYNGTIRISASGASNTPEDIRVTFTVSPAPTPTISVTPASLTFSAVAGGGGPLSQTVSVSNSGGGTLNWLASVTSGSFLTLVGTTSGANSGSFQVFADVGALSAGTYNGTIRITASGASNSPLDIPVTFTVSPAPTITPGVWTSGGPYGGNIQALAINPMTPAILYAGTDAGVFKSTNSGATWSAANSGLTDLEFSPVMALVIDPTTPTTIFAGIWQGGVFKSTDSGGTWVNTGLTTQYLQTLAIDPTSTTTLYAGTLDGGVFKSTDSGATWAAVNAGLTRLNVCALAINLATPQTLYAGTDAGVFKSSDSGGTWAAANMTQYVQALAIDPTTPATLYAGTSGGGIFKLTDSGGTWAAANTGLTTLEVAALAINPEASTLYTGTYDGGLFKSTDSGGTWTAASTGLTYLDVAALAINPTTPATLYAGTDAGVFKSTDSGGTWTAANTVPDYPPGWRSGDQSYHPHHPLRRNVRRRHLQVHRLRRYLGHRQHGTDYPPGWRSGDQSYHPQHPLRRNVRRRHLQVHRLRRYLGHRQHGTDEHIHVRRGAGDQPHDPRHALRRDIRRGLQVHRLRRHLGRRQHGAADRSCGSSPERPRPGDQSHDPHHALCRGEWLRGLQVHRLRRHLDCRQHWIDERAERQCPGNQSHDSRHALRRDVRSSALAAGSSSRPIPAAPGPPRTRVCQTLPSTRWL